MQVVTPNTEAAILARLIQANESMNREVAEYLLSIDFGSRDMERMNFLSDLAQKGNLSPSESAELDSYLHVGNLLAIMQSKARGYLKMQNLSPHSH
jgi:hypothetical protein